MPFPRGSPFGTDPKAPAPGGERVRCPDCDLAQRLPRGQPGRSILCGRCRALLRSGAKPAPEVPLCLALAALSMWLAANCTPFLSLRYQGVSTTSYLAGGAEALWEQGFYLLSSLVFVTGIVAPLLDLTGLVVLLLILRRGRRPRGLGMAIRFLKALGPWTMPGILLVGVLVAAVKMAQMASFEPGAGFAALAALVILWISAHAMLDLDAFWEFVEVER